MSIRVPPPRIGLAAELPSHLTSHRDLPGSRAMQQLSQIAQGSTVTTLRGLTGDRRGMPRGLGGSLERFMKQGNTSPSPLREAMQRIGGAGYVPPFGPSQAFMHRLTQEQGRSSSGFGPRSAVLQQLMDDMGGSQMAQRLTDPTGVMARMRTALAPTAFTSLVGKNLAVLRHDSRWADLIHRQAAPLTLADVMSAPAFPAAAALIDQYLPQEEASADPDALQDGKTYQAVLSALNALLEGQERMEAQLHAHGTQLDDLATPPAAVQVGTQVFPTGEVMQLLLMLIFFLFPFFSDEAFEDQITQQLNLIEARVETVIRGQAREEQRDQAIAHDMADMKVDIQAVQQGLATLLPTHTVGERSVRVRQRPRDGSHVTATLAPNVGVTVVAAAGQWVKVEWHDLIAGQHRSGWCLKKYLQRAKYPAR